MTKNKVYDIVTERIIEKLEAGVVPWKKGWVDGKPVNWVTQKPYRGINLLLLDSGGEYATAKQIMASGGKIKKGSKASIAVFYKMLKHSEDEEKTFPLLRYYSLFDINTQVEGLTSKKKKLKEQTISETDCSDVADALINKYINDQKITLKPGEPSYAPEADSIQMPDKTSFFTIAEYYSTFFHEIVHSTGHHTRLNRGLTGYSNNKVEYSLEELVAEFGSAMLSSDVGLFDDTLENNAAYIASWKRFLKDDNTAIVKAASKAQKAYDFVCGIEDITANA